MSTRDTARFRPSRLYARLAVPLAVLTMVALSVRADPSLGDPTTAAGLLRTTASVLLLGVATAAAHAVFDRRQAQRHDSIRAEIAAAGGLHKRLMV